MTERTRAGRHAIPSWTCLFPYYKGKYSFPRNGIGFVMDLNGSNDLQSEKANVMRNIRVEKLVINICVGESGDAISKAARVLQQISGQEPVYGKGG